LVAAADSGEVSPEAARDLRDTLEFIAGLRLAHQTRQVAAGLEPDNHLRLAELSSFERRTLRDAFRIVQRLQAVLAQRYQAGRF
ncbi:putative nucleotidyltransferase substrate binding domain-containing protein, partial [Melaminivora alkalimesophila]